MGRGCSVQNLEGEGRGGEGRGGEGRGGEGKVKKRKKNDNA